MTNDFLFGGHGSAIDDLEALKRTVDEETMPPFRYKIMHWSSGLTEIEKNKIKDWIQNSIEKINNKEK